MENTNLEKTSHYEILYIISNQFTEEEIKPIIEKVNNIIAKNKGQNIKSEEWGKRKLAYAIKNFTFGYYNLVEFGAPNDQTNKIQETLKLTSEILRFQLVVKDLSKVRKPILKDKAKSNQHQAEKREEDREEKEAPRKKVDLEELDKKLDKVLDTDDLI